MFSFAVLVRASLRALLDHEYPDSRGLNCAFVYTPERLAKALEMLLDVEGMSRDFDMTGQRC